MSLLTSFLGLFKWDTSDNTDLNSKFQINKALNENWNIIDSYCENFNTSIMQNETNILKNTNDITSLKERTTNTETNIATLQSDSGHIIELSLNNNTYVLTVTLKNKAGTVLNTSSVDFPVEELILDLDYDSTTKEIVITLKSGTVRRIPLADLISGLVSQGDFDELEDRVDDIEEGQAEQNTAITQNANNIASLQAENADLQEQIKDKENNELKGTASGTSIHLSDSADSRVANVNLNGNSKQGTTSISAGDEYDSPSPEHEQPIKSCGEDVQLFDNNQVPYYNVEGYASYSALNTGVRVICNRASDNLVIRYKILDLTGHEGKKITVKANVKSSANNPGLLYLRIVDTDGNLSDDFPASTSATTLNGILTASITVPDKLDETYHYLALALYGTRGAIPNVGDYVDYNELKVIAGATIASWSPYGMGSISKKITNKNYYRLEDIQEKTQNGVTYSIKDGVIKLNGDCTGGFNILLNSRYSLKAGNYTMSAKILSGSYTGTIGKYVKDSNNLNIIDGNVIDITVKRTLSQDYTNCRSSFFIGKNATFNNFEALVQLEAGETASEAIPNQEQVYAIPTQQPMRSDGDVRDKFIPKDGKWYERHNIIKYLFTGNESWSKAPNGFIIQNFANIDSYEARCNRFVCSNSSTTWTGENQFGFNSLNTLWFQTTKFTTIEEWKEYLKNNETYIEYVSKNYIDLPCTQEQIKALEAYRKARTYKNVTHIYSEDEVEAVVDLTYVKDLQNYLDNIDTRLSALESEV